MNRYLLGLVALAAVVYLGTRVRGPSNLDRGLALVSPTESDDPCEAKENCVVAYVAPWCGACKQVLPHFLKLGKNWAGSETRGLKIVVGAGRESENLKLAQTIGANAFVDANGDFARQMKVRHYPSVWVVDSAQRVIASDQAAFKWISKDGGFR